MGDAIIQVDGLGKLYNLGKSRQRQDTLRDELSAGFAASLRGIKTLLLPEKKNGKIADQSRDSQLWALKDVTFEVTRGEIVGLIGSNGAGKSTLLKLLSQITEPTTGRALIQGRIGSLLEVGTGFHPELTGSENIYLNGAILGMTRSEIKRKFDEIVDFAEIERFLDLPVKRYSSGMYVRLGFAVAANLETEVLLVDEVLAVGDAGFQRKCLGKMDDVSKEGRTIIFVSHNMNAIQRLCTRVIHLEQGKIKQQGQTGEVIRDYLSTSATASEPETWLDTTPLSRDGTQEVRIEAIKFSSHQQKIDCHPFPDGPLTFWLKIFSTMQRSLGSLAVTIYDAYGTKLVNADTMAIGRVLNLHPGLNEVRLEIQNVHLNPGQYIVGLWAADPAGEVFDTITSAFKIEFLDLGSAGEGVKPKSDGLIPCKFDAFLGL